MELLLERLEREDPPLELGRREEHVRHLPELNPDELLLPFHERGLQRLLPQPIAKRERQPPPDPRPRRRTVSYARRYPRLKTT